jgi:hypothetical protein
MKLEVSKQIFGGKKLKYHVSSKSVQLKPNSSIRASGRTDMKKLIVAYRNFVNALDKMK